MWFEMFLDLDGGLQEYLFYNNLYYSVPYIKFHKLKKGNWGWKTSAVSIRLYSF